ncbi:MAG: ABC transporter substrate-binding protein [Puniceicoccales bacterium]|jgi:iron complex transport system substrate-binding protein|nr:ABC transporter substrate-binding protein [Puniceicoccales bacterium]
MKTPSPANRRLCVVIGLALTLILPALAVVVLRKPADATAPPSGGSVRIVSQTAGTDEFLLALADPAQIAALSQLAHDPRYSATAEQARAYPRLPDNADAETILRHRPTHVLFADFSRPDLVAQVRRSGVAVLVFDRYNTLEDTYANLQRLASLLGADATRRAGQIISESQRRVNALREKLQGVKPVRVVSISIYGLIPGDRTNFQDFCDHAGAENLAKTLGKITGHAPPNAERLLGWPVEKLVLVADSSTPHPDTPPTAGEIEQALDVFRKINPYRFMPAVRETRAVLLPAWQGSCVTHHRIACYEYLARQLHPERFLREPGEKTPP